jgi:hypothetical protein
LKLAAPSIHYLGLRVLQGATSSTLSSPVSTVQVFLFITDSPPPCVPYCHSSGFRSRNFSPSSSLEMARGRGSASARRAIAMAFAVACCCCVLAGASTTYYVGDGNGWSFSSASWPNGKQFHAGDVLGNEASCLERASSLAFCSRIWFDIEIDSSSSSSACWRLPQCSGTCR